MSLPNYFIVRVTGKRVNRGAWYGLEIPVDYVFFSHGKAIKWLQNKFEVVEKELASNVKQNNFVSVA